MIRRSLEPVILKRTRCVRCPHVAWEHQHGYKEYLGCCRRCGCNDFKALPLLKRMMNSLRINGSRR